MKTAWFNKPELKATAMRQLRHHRSLDEITQGIYFKEGRGCHLGCLTHRNNNTQQAAERMFGIPERVAYWLDAVFEGLPEDMCAAWVIDGTNAIPVGADLSLAHHELAYWLLGPESPSAQGNAHKAVSAEVETVRQLHKRASAGNLVTDSEWSAAESAAQSAELAAAESAEWSAWSAAWSARSAARSARSAAWSAAESAAESAESAAELAAESARLAELAAELAEQSAAESAEQSAAEQSAWSAESAARYNAWEQIAEKSIEIFNAAPVRG